MRTIFKYVFDSSGVISLKGMLSPAVAFVGLDPATGAPAVWIEHFTENPESIIFQPQDVSLRIVGTGSQAPEKFMHVGSMIAGLFVWHVYAQFKASK